MPATRPRSARWPTGRRSRWRTPAAVFRRDSATPHRRRGGTLGSARATQRMARTRSHRQRWPRADRLSPPARPTPMPPAPTPTRWPWRRPVDSAGSRSGSPAGSSSCPPNPARRTCPRPSWARRCSPRPGRPNAPANPGAAAAAGPARDRPAQADLGAPFTVLVTTVLSYRLSEPIRKWWRRRRTGHAAWPRPTDSAGVPRSRADGCRWRTRPVGTGRTLVPR